MSHGDGDVRPFENLKAAPSIVEGRHPASAAHLVDGATASPGRCAQKRWQPDGRDGPPKGGHYRDVFNGGCQSVVSR